MTKQILQAYAQIEAIKLEAMGMQAENMQARLCGNSVPYGEQHFYTLAEQVKAIANGLESRPTRKTASNKFVPPSDTDLVDYCKKCGYPVKYITAFMAYYGSNGWMVGRTKMKDWKSSYRGWCLRNGFDPSPGEPDKNDASSELARLKEAGHV